MSSLGADSIQRNFFERRLQAGIGRCFESENSECRAKTLNYYRLLVRRKANNKVPMDQATTIYP
jgi:hypothetical protein